MTLFVDQALRFTSTGVTLEDGDFVVLRPLLGAGSMSWAGNVLRGATGPAGDPTTNAPVPTSFSEPFWPLPGAPMFALLAEAGATVLVGGTTLTQVVNRTSTFKPGTVLNLFINDDQPGGFGAWGGYFVRVLIFRK